MLVYAVLAGANGTPVDDEIIRRFERDDLPEIPFCAESRVVWRNHDGSVVFLGWQAFTDLAGIGSHWVVDERGLTAFSGHCWPRTTGWNHDSGVPWAAQLREWIEPRTRAAARDGLFGQFTLISLAHTGPSWITPDFGGFDPVMMAQHDEVTALSNRAGLCARAVTPAGVEPARSLTGAGWLICHTEMFFDGETGYWEVERIPLGAHIAIDPERGAAVIEAERCPLGPGGPESTYAEQLDLVEADLRQTIRAIAALPLRHRQLSLSGGFDSRVLIAAILAEGLQDRFAFVTTGPPERADPIVAGLLARRFALDWTLIDQSERSVTDERAEVLAHASLVEGMTSSWTAAGPLTYTGTGIVSGMAGEYVRWGRTSRAGMLVSSEAELIALLRRNINFDPIGLMRPEILEYYHQTVARWAREQLARGETLPQVASYFNQSGQARNRFAVSQTWGGKMMFTAFITPTFVRANQQLPADQRPDSRFQIDLMRRLQPELSTLPFAEHAWSAEAIAHLPDAEDYRAIAPIRTTSPNGRTWRVLRYQDYLPMLNEYLLDRSNPVHELIDSDKLERVLPTGARHAGRTRRLWALLAAAVWMGRLETPTRIERA